VQVYPDDSRDAPSLGVGVRRGGQFHVLYCRSGCQDVQARSDLLGAVPARCRLAVEQVTVRAFHVFGVSCAGPSLNARQVQKVAKLASLLGRGRFPECCDCGSPVLR
jgi:hypothetical protein